MSKYSALSIIKFKDITFNRCRIIKVVMIETPKLIKVYIMYCFIFHNDIFNNAQKLRFSVRNRRRVLTFGFL